MKLIKIPHSNAQDILSCYQPNAPILDLLDDTMSPQQMIEKAIEAELFSDTALFIAHGLPIREAIWWATQCAGTRNDWSEDEINAISAAKAWVQTPDETNRRHAEEMAKVSTLETGAGWSAQAAFWSGGSMTSPKDPIVPPPPYIYAQAVAGCVNLCAVLPDGADAKDRYQHYFKIAMDIACGGNGVLAGES